jgi:hypothetical protein
VGPGVSGDVDVDGQVDELATDGGGRMAGRSLCGTAGRDSHSVRGGTRRRREQEKKEKKRKRKEKKDLRRVCEKEFLRLIVFHRCNNVLFIRQGEVAAKKRKVEDE